jgi:LuxR family transcriptional regulator, maltose regulon positive regulatory protein
VHNLLIELAHHWPRPLHLVLISRIEPSLPLSSLRAKGMLHEIRTQKLRFTPEETTAYLSQSQLTLQSQKDMHLLEERFEGWPAGLHLAALSLRSAGSQEAVLSVLSSENANITSFLIDEVLSHQFPAINSFLIRTCILDRFCVPLCEAILGKVDPAWNARACLDWIERAELFIIPLDERREWYRYHHLFQELLQQRLSAEMSADQVSDLHCLASVWLEEHGLIDDALHHALAAGDLDLAARQMNAGLREVINREDWPTLDRWLRQLPEEMIKQHPELQIIRAWILNFLWRLDLQAQVVHQAAELLDSEVGARLSAEDQQILRGQILMLRAQFAYFGNEVEAALVLSKEALALLPTPWTFARGAAILYLGLSMQANGQIQEAEKLLFDEYESNSDKTDIYPLVILQTLGYIYLWTVQHEKARQIGQVLIQGATSSGILTMKNWGEYYLGVACYRSNDLEAADQYFTEILKNRFIAHAAAYRDAVAGLVLIHQIKGESSEAWQMLESISRADLEETGTENSQTSSLRARLMLVQGDIEGAGRWVDTFSGLPPDQSLLWMEEPQVTRVRVLAARGTDADINLALQILDTLDEIADRTHKICYKIELLALRALVLDVVAQRAVAQRAVGETSSAKASADSALKQALDLARPGGFIRVFVDLGVPMQRLLRRIERQDPSTEMIRRILAAFQADDKNLPGNASPAQQRRQPSLANLTLAEPLTQRELDVLTLLRDPLSIKEIALKLNISHATASRHTVNIYAKLGANSRSKAVARAEELNILPSD